jgi:hypothetical protein
MFTAIAKHPFVVPNWYNIRFPETQQRDAHGGKVT